MIPKEMASEVKCFIYFGWFVPGKYKELNVLWNKLH